MGHACISCPLPHRTTSSLAAAVRIKHRRGLTACDFPSQTHHICRSLKHLLRVYWVAVKKPILRIPNLCIHLQTADERSSFKVNKENHLCPILSLQRAAEDMLNDDDGNVASACDSRHPPLLLRVIAEELGVSAADIRDLELSLCDTQPARVWGVGSEFLSSPRLDNQVHCYTSAEALVEHANLSMDHDTGVAMIALFDHEEVGSQSAQVRLQSPWFASQHITSHRIASLDCIMSERCASQTVHA